MSSIQAHLHFTVQIKVSLVSHAQDGRDRLHVLGVGQADGLDVDVDGLRDAGLGNKWNIETLGINVFLSVFIHISVVYKSKSAFAFHCTNCSLSPLVISLILSGWRGIAFTFLLSLGGGGGLCGSGGVDGLGEDGAHGDVDGLRFVFTSREIATLTLSP